MSTQILSLLSAEALKSHYGSNIWRDETIYQMLRARAGTAPDDFALSDRHRRLTFAELAGLVDSFAAELAARGIGRGQRVVLWMPDRIESAVALFACSRNGLVCCPSPHRNHTVAETAALMERMRASALIWQIGFGADSGDADIVAATAHLGSLRHVWRLAPDSPGPAGAGLMGKCPPGTSPPDSYNNPDSITYLAFTSGSTGQPKGVMHSDNTLLMCAREIASDWKIDSGGAVMSLSPFSHNLGIGALLTALAGGAEFVIHGLTRGESLADRLIETGASYLVGVPTHAIDLLAEIKERGITDFSQLKGFRISGAAVPAQIITELLALGVTPQSGYGMTETNAHQYTHPGDDPALMRETSGRACRGYELRVFDEDDPDRPLPPGGTGQIGGRGGCLMLGYYDDQTATEQSFNSDGWFMTGDIGSLDANGYLRITGRRKEIIIRGGHNINPARIEELAMRHGALERAAAIPVADPRLGEKVCLAIMFRDGQKADAAELLDHLKAEGLSKFDMPEYIAEFDDLPLMPNGKIEKRDIAARLGDGTVTARPVADTNRKGAA